MRTAVNLSIALVLAFLLIDCQERDKKGRILDTPTAGNISIAVDESLKPLMEAEIHAFESIYVNAHIHIMYVSESDAFEALQADRVRLVVATRKLYADEEDQLLNEKIVAVQTKIAKGAVAVIANRNNADSLINVSQLKQMLTGKVTHWNQVSGKSVSSPIEIIFDHSNSGIARYLKDSVTDGAAFSSNCFALDSNQAVIDFVSRKPNALGLIGVEWISDRDDSMANKFLNAIRVVSVAGDSAFMQPHQAYIALKQYPLCRDIFIVSREARSGLGSGLTAFIAGDKGQRIVLKSGLVPATMPIRIVEINRDDE